MSDLVPKVFFTLLGLVWFIFMIWYGFQIGKPDYVKLEPPEINDLPPLPVPQPKPVEVKKRRIGLLRDE